MSTAVRGSRSKSRSRAPSRKAKENTESSSSLSSDGVPTDPAGVLPTLPVEASSPLSVPNSGVELQAVLQSLAAAIPAAKIPAGIPPTSVPSTSSKTGKNILSSLQSHLKSTSFRPETISISSDDSDSSPDDEDDYRLTAVASSSSKNNTAFAKNVVRNAINQYGNMKAWVLHAHWNSPRNKHEVLALCTSLDFFITSGISLNHPGVDVLVRRAVGVQLADQHNNWSLCEALCNFDASSIVPRDMLHSLFAQAHNIQKLTAKIDGSKKVTPSRSYSAASSSNSGYKPNQKNPSSSSSGDPPAKAVSGGRN